MAVYPGGGGGRRCPPPPPQPPPYPPMRDSWLEVKKIDVKNNFIKLKLDFVSKGNTFWTPLRSPETAGPPGPPGDELYESIYDSRWRLLNQVCKLKLLFLFFFVFEADRLISTVSSATKHLLTS